jgi:hypothetical protein
MRILALFLTTQVSIGFLGKANDCDDVGWGRGLDRPTFLGRCSGLLDEIGAAYNGRFECRTDFYTCEADDTGAGGGFLNTPLTCGWVVSSR